MQAQMEPVKESDAQKIARLEDEVRDLEKRLDIKDEQLRSMEQDLDSSYEENRKLERDNERLEDASNGDPFAVASSVHNFLRDSGIIKDPALDVPLKVAAQPWVSDLVQAVSDGMP